MSLSERFSSLEEEVSNTFVHRLYGEWTTADQAELERRLASDVAYAEAYRLAEHSADVLRTSAEMPEMMRFREQAIAYARRSSVKRWLGSNASHGRQWRWAAGLVAGLVALTTLWQLSPWRYQPDQYRTGIDEQRILELDDHSRVALDAKTCVAIRYTDENRAVELIEGQAQFSVGKDPTRPFRVRVGDHTIVALGTVFTVEFTDQKLRVAIVDGRVAVVPSNAHAHSLLPGRKTGVLGPLTSQDLEAIELSAGEELKIGRDGHSTLIPNADLEAATAWRNGKVVFRTERLADAIRRMNRYSKVQLEIGNPTLADETVSGVFEAGDTQGFIAGVQLALPVVASYRDSNTVRLSLSPGAASQHP